MKKFNLHLVSDSTGETVGSVARAALVQFDDVDAEEFSWTLVRSKSQLEKALEGIRENLGVVMYTLVDEKLRETLHIECAKLGLPCIAVLSSVVAEISNYLGVKSHAQAGKPVCIWHIRVLRRQISRWFWIAHCHRAWKR